MDITPELSDRVKAQHEEQIYGRSLTDAKQIAEREGFVNIEIMSNKKKKGAKNFRQIVGVRENGTKEILFTKVGQTGRVYDQNKEILDAFIRTSGSRIRR